jgi:hypothetical protein
MAQAVEHLLCEHKALSSNPNPTNTKQQLSIYNEGQKSKSILPLRCHNKMLLL